MASFDLNKHTKMAMAVHHAIGISRQRNSGYRRSRVGKYRGTRSLPLVASHTQLSVRRGCATLYTTHTIRLARWFHTTLH